MLHCDVIGSQFETFRNDSVGCITGICQVSGNHCSTFIFSLILICHWSFHFSYSIWIYMPSYLQMKILVVCAQVSNSVFLY